MADVYGNEYGRKWDGSLDKLLRISENGVLREERFYDVNGRLERVLGRNEFAEKEVVEQVVKSLFLVC